MHHDSAKRPNKKNKNPLDVVGQSEDGRNVVDFFRLVDSHGLSIDFVLEQLESKNLVPSWISFWESSLKCGWNSKSTLIKLENAIIDVYGPVYHKTWKEKMRFYIAHRELYLASPGGSKDETNRIADQKIDQENDRE